MNENQIIREDFDRIASLGEKKWDHNRHYHRYLAKWIPKPCNHALDIGCGIGEFTRLLAARSGHVVGLDLSPRMLEEAAERSQEFPHIEYCLQDVMKWPLQENQYDCVVSIATVHHLPMEEFLIQVRNALRPGGTILILDLYQEKTLGDRLWSSVAVPINLVIMLLQTGRLNVTEEERRAWDEHGQHDTYLTLQEIREVCQRVLPGAKVKRHLFWRYSLVWKK